MQCCCILFFFLLAIAFTEIRVSNTKDAPHWSVELTGAGKKIALHESTSVALKTVTHSGNPPLNPQMFTGKRNCFFTIKAKITGTPLSFHRIRVLHLEDTVLISTEGVGYSHMYDHFDSKYGMKMDLVHMYDGDTNQAGHAFLNANITLESRV